MAGPVEAVMLGTAVGCPRTGEGKLGRRGEGSMGGLLREFHSSFSRHRLMSLLDSNESMN